MFLPALKAIAPRFFQDNLRSGVAYEAKNRPWHAGHEEPHLEGALLLLRAHEHGAPYVHLPGAVGPQKQEVAWNVQEFP
jgi:hypothetical protein